MAIITKEIVYEETSLQCISKFGMHWQWKKYNMNIPLAKTLPCILVNKYLTCYTKFTRQNKIENGKS
jgi:hypothetical protein